MGRAAGLRAGSRVHRCVLFVFQERISEARPRTRVRAFRIPEGTAPRPAASSPPPQPCGSEHVRPWAQLPLVPNVHLVLGLGQHEGAGGQAQPSLGRCGLWAAGAALRALGPIWRFGLILTFPQLLFMLHPPVLEPRFHLISGGKKYNHVIPSDP